MIVGHIGLQNRYAHLDDKVERALTYTHNHDLSALADGTVIEVDEDISIRIMHYATAPAQSMRFESHKHHFDIQYMIDGEERFGYVPQDVLIEDGAYDAPTDTQFYMEPAYSGSVILHAGEYIVTTPEDAHKPACMLNEPQAVKKAVIKVRINE